MPEISVDLTNLKELMNEVYIPLVKDKSRYPVLYGGAGSGKSVFCAQKIVIRMLSETPHKFLVVRKVANTLRHSVFAEILNVISMWGLNKEFAANQSSMEITCRNGNKIIFAGLDDVEKLKSIQGVSSIWVEEATQLTAEDFRQLRIRMRGKRKHYKQIMVSFNPINVGHWLKKHFFDRQQSNAIILKTTYKDNRFLDDDDRQELENLKYEDEVMYQIYALGEWGVYGELILTNYVIEEFPQEENYFDAITDGQDYGFNHKSAHLNIAMKDGELYIVREIAGKKWTNTVFIEEVERFIPKNRRIIGDSAEPDRILEFKRAGYTRIKAAVKGKDSRKHGRDFLRRYRIHIHPSCVNTIDEIQAWQYRKDKDDNVLDEEVDFNNDCMSALIYACEDWRKQRGTGKPDTSGLDSFVRESPWF